MMLLMRSASTTICLNYGLCQLHLFYPMEEQAAVFLFHVFLISVEDSLDSIMTSWNENVWLASNGGGIGTYWGKVRSIGEKVGQSGKTSGIIPFVRVMDSLTLAISQGSLRRGSAAVYLDIHHPEIEEFLEIRKPLWRLQQKVLSTFTMVL